MKVAFAITEPDAGTNSHNLSTSPARGRPLRPPRPEDVHLGRRGRRRAARRRAHRRERDGEPRPASRCSSSTWTRPGSRAAHPDAAARRGPAVDAVLRRRRGRRAERLIGGENGGLGDGVRRPEPRADHGRGAIVGVGAPRAGAAATTPASAESGASRSAPTRASRTRSPRPRSSWSWPAHDPKAAALYDAGRRARARRRTWRSTPRPRPRSTASTPRSRPTAATASRSSTGSPRCGGERGSMRIAPVSREMVLNYVAEHSLGLPRSY